MLKKFLIMMMVLLFPFLPARAERAEEEIELPVVMYHHISARSRCWNDYVISIEEFRSDMEYLKSHGWESISLDELLAWQRGEFTMPEKPMMITFDDGFYSVVEYAEPIMAELGFRGVVAVIGSVCDRYSSSGECDPEWSDLSWEAAADMQGRGVLDVQCHTWNMHSMDNALGCAKKWGESPQAYRKRLSGDLSRFLTACEKHGIGPIYAIAYPYGAFDSNTTEIIRNMDFRAAFTCTERVNHLTGDADELFFLGRFNRPHGVSSEKFFGKWERNA